MKDHFLGATRSYAIARSGEVDCPCQATRSKLALLDTFLYNQDEASPIKRRRILDIYDE